MNIVAWIGENLIKLKFNSWGFDGVVWHASGIGLYSTTSGYKLLLGVREKFDLAKVVWRSF